MMFEKLIGISFISAAADIILSGSPFRKYVKTVTGAVFSLVLITGLFNLPLEIEEFPGLQEQSSEVEAAKKEYEKMLSERVVLSVENKIREKLSEEGIGIKHIEIDFFPDYSVKKIKIITENSSQNRERVINILKKMGFTKGVTVL